MDAKVTLSSGGGGGFGHGAARSVSRGHSRDRGSRVGSRWEAGERAGGKLRPAVRCALGCKRCCWPVRRPGCGWSDGPRDVQALILGSCGYCVKSHSNRELNSRDSRGDIVTHRPCGHNLMTSVPQGGGRRQRVDGRPESARGCRTRRRTRRPQPGPRQQPVRQRLRQQIRAWALRRGRGSACTFEVTPETRFERLTSQTVKS